MVTERPSGFAVRARGLVKRYGSTTALAGIDFEVPTGSVTAVLGPNGAGKTTAIRILTTLADADEGEATVAGFDVAQHPGEVRRRIGLAAQDATVDPLLTGRENLVMLSQLHQFGRRASKDRAARLLEEFSLVDAADRVTSGYSGGMRRRLDLAATLVSDPEVLFLDEPTTGLDPRARTELWAVLENLVERGTTLLLTTQYLEEAEHLADDIIVIDHGRIIARGDARKLKREVGGDQLNVVISESGSLDDAARVVADGDRRRAPDRPRGSNPDGAREQRGGDAARHGQCARRRGHRARRHRPAPAQPRRGVPDPDRCSTRRRTTRGR